MKPWHYLAIGFAAGVIFTFFTSMLTELVVVAAIVGIGVYLWKRKFGPKDPDIPSTTKTSL